MNCAIWDWIWKGGGRLLVLLSFDVIPTPFCWAKNSMYGSDHASMRWPLYMNVQVPQRVRVPCISPFRAVHDLSPESACKWTH